MGFPSPAQDYIEGRIDLNDLLMPNRSNTIRIETPDGFVLVDRSVRINPGDAVAFQTNDDYPQLAKYFPTGLITQDGETLDAEGLEGVILLGKITAEVLAVYEPYRPII